MSGGRCYLMGLHANGDRLWYALSADGRHFEPERELAHSRGAQDRYIVALGWVTDGDRLLGFLYGASAVPTLDRNRIFACWLQPRLVFSTDGAVLDPPAALGPDRQVLALNGQALRGKLEVFDVDGRTPLGPAVDVSLQSGAIYRLVLAGTRSR